MNQTSQTLDELMTQFRVASRELFNVHFRMPNPYQSKDAWRMQGEFARLENVLFRSLVTSPLDLPESEYGSRQANILVAPKEGLQTVPAMINRDVDSGYWDNPTAEVSSGARMAFIRFFDWDQLSIRDNRYARVSIDAWKDRSDLVGKHALVEAQNVRFVLRS